MSRGQTPAAGEARRGDTLAVRPYALTRGRTRAAGNLTVESLVVVTATGLEQMRSLPGEYRRILRLASMPVSVAEVAAHTSTMVGVTKVLIGDLVTNGLLALRQGVAAGAPPPEILERVLRGLQSL